MHHYAKIVNSTIQLCNGDNNKSGVASLNSQINIKMCSEEPNNSGPKQPPLPILTLIITSHPFILLVSHSSPLLGVGVTRQLRSVQVFPAGGEHGDQRLLLGRCLHAAAVPGSLSVDERPAAVPQPLPAGEAQVSVNYVTQSAPGQIHGSRAQWTLQM